MCVASYDGTMGNWLLFEIRSRVFFVEFWCKKDNTDSLSKIFLKYDSTLTQQARRIFLSVRCMGISNYALDLMHIAMLKLVEGVGKYPKASTYTCFPRIPTCTSSKPAPHGCRLLIPFPK